MFRDILDSLPLWGALLITISMILLAIELGFRMGGYHQSKKQQDGNHQVVSMTGAHLGLLAFILAFSFSMSAGHFDKRKTLLLEEVNAIETAYLRATLVAEPQRGEITSLLTDYTAARSMGGGPAVIARVIEESETLQRKIWLVVEQLPSKDTLTVMDSLLVQAINDVFDLHKKRLYAGMNNRIPANIWVALYTILILSMVGMGFSMGITGKRNAVSSISLALSFSMVMFVVADLDRPMGGLVQADQTLMMNLNRQLEKLKD